MNERIECCMIRHRPRGSAAVRGGALVALVLSVGVVVDAGESPATDTNSAIPSAESLVQELTRQIPQSVFIARKDEGIRDPFFPESTRLWDDSPGNQSTEPLPIDELIRKYVFLRGITGQEGDKVALVNNQTFKVGDTQKVRLADPARTVLSVTMQKVLEISVEFTVEGVNQTFTKELEE